MRAQANHCHGLKEHQHRQGEGTAWPQRQGIIASKHILGPTFVICL